MAEVHNALDMGTRARQPQPVLLRVPELRGAPTAGSPASSTPAKTSAEPAASGTATRARNRLGIAWSMGGKVLHVVSRPIAGIWRKGRLTYQATSAGHPISSRLWLAAIALTCISGLALMTGMLQFANSPSSGEVLNEGFDDVAEVEVGAPVQHPDVEHGDHRDHGMPLLTAPSNGPSLGAFPTDSMAIPAGGSEIGAAASNSVQSAVFQAVNTSPSQGAWLEGTIIED